jgi:hypothetical protein
LNGSLSNVYRKSTFEHYTGISSLQKQSSGPVVHAYDVIVGRFHGSDGAVGLNLWRQPHAGFMVRTTVWILEMRVLLVCVSSIFPTHEGNLLFAVV